MELRVGVPLGVQIPTCAQNVVFPAAFRHCAEPGFFVEYSLSVSTAFFGRDSSVRVLPTPHMDFQFETRMASDNSSLAMVERGEADFTPRALLDKSRTSRLNFSLFPTGYTNTQILYRIYPQDLQTLTLRRLLILPSGIWWATTIAFAIWWIHRFMIRRYRSRDKREKSHCSSCTCKSHLNTARHSTTGTSVSLVAGILLSVLSNYLCILFSVARPPNLPVDSFQSFLDKALARDLVIIIPHKINSRIILNHVARVFPNEFAYFKALSVSAVTTKEALDLLRNDSLSWDGRNIAVITHSESQISKDAKSTICNLAVVDLKDIPSSRVTIYSGPRLNLQVNSSIYRFLQVEETRLDNKYHPMATCANTIESDGFQLSLGKLIGAFQAMLIFLAASGGILGLEAIILAIHQVFTIFSRDFRIYVSF